MTNVGQAATVELANVAAPVPGRSARVLGLIAADAYVREHTQIVRADTIATAIELARAKPLFDQNRDQFHQFVRAQGAIRGLAAITMLDNELNVIDAADAPANQTFIKPPKE